MTLLAKVLSCLESTWSLTASNLVRKNVAINQPFANYMSHKVKKALALVMIWVARHLGDEPVLAVGSLSRDKQRSISQLLLSKRQCSCSQQVGGPASSQHCLYLQKFLNCIQSISSAKTMTQKKFRFYSCWCRRKSPDKMTCWEVANWTELLYWGCLTLVSWLLKRSKKPRRRKNAPEGGWERDKQDAGCRMLNFYLVCQINLRSCYLYCLCGVRWMRYIEWGRSWNMVKESTKRNVVFF